MPKPTDRDPAVAAWDAALNDARTRLNAADPIPAPRTALDRWEDQGWTGPDDEDEARAVYGGGAP